MPLDAAISRRALLAGGASLGALAACGSSSTTASATPVDDPPGSTLVMLIRHAEKPKGSHAPYGVTADGERDEASLTVQGWTRAGALVELFDPHSGPLRQGLLRQGLLRPRRVVAAHPDPSSRRPFETITPLAARLGVAPDTRWSVGEEKQAATAVAKLSGVALVAWEHKHIPALAAAFGHVSPAPPTHWPSDRFDVVWCLRRHGDGWVFGQVPQLLLAGDAATVI